MCVQNRVSALLSQRWSREKDCEQPDFLLDEAGKSLGTSLRCWRHACCLAVKKIVTQFQLPSYGIFDRSRLILEFLRFWRLLQDNKTWHILRYFFQSKTNNDLNSNALATLAHLPFVYPFLCYLVSAHPTAPGGRHLSAWAVATPNAPSVKDDSLFNGCGFGDGNL